MATVDPAEAGSTPAELTPWVDDGTAPLLTDLYELTMLQVYFERAMHETAVFDLTVRRLPSTRNYLIACGLEDVLRFLESLAFSPELLARLESVGRFSRRFLDFLSRLRFTGDVLAVPEGTAVFAGEPILEVAAPLPEAQVIETFVLNQIHFQTLVASKAARVVTAAKGRPVVEFGLRRVHGTDAGMKAARASYIAGVSGTSNVLAGLVYRIPVSGTMAHSYVQASADELDAFRAFATLYPDAVLLVDTYDTLEGVREVVRLARELGEGFRVRAIRLDSGDLAALARAAREVLDEAGLKSVQIFASGGLDEYAIASVLEQGAPIDGFGVGTQMGVSADAPFLDCAYKLVEYAGRGRIKLSTGKPSLPGRKQVFRTSDGDEMRRDVLGLADEQLPGEPLLVKVMAGGQRLQPTASGLEESRVRARRSLLALPRELRGLAPSSLPYPVVLSPELLRHAERLDESHRSSTIS